MTKTEALRLARTKWYGWPSLRRMLTYELFFGDGHDKPSRVNRTISHGAALLVLLDGLPGQDENVPSSRTTLVVSNILRECGREPDPTIDEAEEL